MAKTALVNKANKKPKFAVRGYTRCQRCGRPHSVYRKFGLCRICLREMAHRGELPASPRPAGNPGTPPIRAPTPAATPASIRPDHLQRRSAERMRGETTVRKGEKPT